MANYDMLNDMQKEAVFQTKGPLLILAGAGSGKTRAITHRIAYLIENCGVNPWNILAITFTNKAAGEMRERVDGLVGFGSESIWVATFHATCVRILRRYADRIGYDTNFTIYDSDDQKTVIKEVCKKLQIDTKMLKERTIMGAISAAKDALIDPLTYQMEAMGDFQKSKIAMVYAEYQRTMRSNNAMDFDDLICNTVELLRTDGEVLANYQNRFEYIMVDEYQDTNTAQFELIRLLAGGKRNLCVVGDDDQSIYKFRGANIRNILDFELHYPDATVVKLEQNYRSTGNILDAANAVIGNNTARKEKALWTEQDAGEKIHFKQLDTAFEEADFIAYDIGRKHRKLGMRFGDAAVLYRTNAQARLIEEQFIREGIPYNVVGGVNFYSRKEIKDLLAYLKTIDNGRDDVAVKRIINVPRRGIGATTIAKIQQYADDEGISFYDALCECEDIASIGKAASKIKPFVTMIQVFRSKLPIYGLEGLIKDVIETTGYVEMIEAEDEEDGQMRIENIDELISKMVSFEQENEEPTLSTLLEEIALVADIDSADENDDRVLLMTLHSAKGLEFEHVYLAGMEDGVFPGFMTITSDDKTELEEERRLCYVGITRAKQDLTLLCAKSRMVRGETQYNPVSRFLREIPTNLIDGVVPTYKNPGYATYEPDAKPLHMFKQKPFYQTMAPQPKPDVVSNSTTKNFGLHNTNTTAGPRPKASVKPKVTQPQVKPFISKMTEIPGVSKGMPQGGGALPYGVGDRVRHVKFGEGQVLSIEEGNRDHKVTVLFDDAQYGQKIMYALFAKLEKI